MQDVKSGKRERIAEVQTENCWLLLDSNLNLNLKMLVSV